MLWSNTRAEAKGDSCLAFQRPRDSLIPQCEDASMGTRITSCGSTSLPSHLKRCRVFRNVFCTPHHTQKLLSVKVQPLGTKVIISNTMSARNWRNDISGVNRQLKVGQKQIHGREMVCRINDLTCIALKAQITIISTSLEKTHWLNVLAA